MQRRRRTGFVRSAVRVRDDVRAYQVIGLGLWRVNRGRAPWQAAKRHRRPARRARQLRAKL